MYVKRPLPVLNVPKKMKNMEAPNKEFMNSRWNTTSAIWNKMKTMNRKFTLKWRTVSRYVTKTLAQLIPFKALMYYMQAMIRIATPLNLSRDTTASLIESKNVR